MKQLKFLQFIVLCLAISAMQNQVFSQDKKDACSTQKFEVKEIGVQKALIVKYSIPTPEISTKIGEAYSKIYSFLGQKQLNPAGAPFAVYLEYDPNGSTVFEAGVPITENVETSGDVVLKEYPAMKVLSTLFKGSYDKVGPVYEAMSKYMADKGMQPTNVAWEVYITDPSQVKDPNDNQIIIYMPLK